MKAVCYYGKEDLRVENVPDPEIVNPRDAIVKVTTSAICGSDLHIYDGYRTFRDKQDDCIKVVIKPGHNHTGGVHHGSQATH